MWNPFSDPLILSIFIVMIIMTVVMFGATYVRGAGIIGAGIGLLLTFAVSYAIAIILNGWDCIPRLLLGTELGLIAGVVLVGVMAIGWHEVRKHLDPRPTP